MHDLELELFGPIGTHKAYENIRTIDNLINLRRYLNWLYINHKKYLDTNFIDEFPLAHNNKFFQRYWELVLASWLKKVSQY